ncbi:MAG: phosphatase PAP2 family protein [Betaproteobacteria bacterium]|nr:phosphatase PAP2 family protein [Betaproteobacteria bacterium]
MTRPLRPSPLVAVRHTPQRLSDTLPWRRDQWLAWSALPLAALMLGLWLLQLPLSAQHIAFLSLNRLATRLPAEFWSFCTLLGDTTVLFALMSPLLLWRPQALMACMAAVPAGALFSVVVKHVSDIPRPGAVLELGQFHLIGPLLTRHSFPSGHAITAFAAAAAVLATAAPRLKSRRSGALLLLVLGLATTVGMSRVAVGAHWPLDVLFGAAGGWLAGLSGALLTRTYRSAWQSPRHQMVLAACLAAASTWLVLRPLDYKLGAPALWLAAASSWACLLALVLRSRPRR